MLGNTSAVFATLFVATTCLSLVHVAMAQERGQKQKRPKRALTHEDYDRWQSITDRAIRRDGEWVAVTISPRRGDGELILRSTVDDRIYRHPRGTGAEFTADGEHVLFRIEPAHAEKRRHEVKRLLEAKKRREAREREEAGGRGSGRRGSSRRGPGRRGPGRQGGRRRGSRGGAGEEQADDDAPKPLYAVMSLTDGKVEILEKAKAAKSTVEGPAFVVYHLRKPKPEKKNTDKEGKEGKPEPHPEEKSEPEPKQNKLHHDGAPLVVRNVLTGKETRIRGVTSFGLTRKTGWLYYVQNSRKDDPEIVRGLHARKPDTGRTVTLLRGAAKFEGFTLDREETRLAFVSNLEDAKAKKPTFDLYTWDFKAPKARLLATHRGDQEFPDGRMVGATGLGFSRQGNVLLFRAVPLPPKDLPDILESEKVVLDLWHWKDPLLQPMQARRAQQLRSQPLVCAWHFDGDRMVVLSQRPTDSVRLISNDGSRALVTNGEPYTRLISWDGRYTDVWVVDTESGSRRKIKTKLRGSAQPSPNGRYVLYFEDREWHSVDTVSGAEVNLTGRLDVPFEREDWDQPSPERAHGIAGWTENDAAVLLYDRYDIWKVEPDGSGATCLTDGHGRRHHIRFRYTRLDPEEQYIPGDQPLLLAALDLDTMDAGFFRDSLQGASEPRKLRMGARSFSSRSRRRRSRGPMTPGPRRFGSGRGIVKAGDHMFFTRSTFREPPDLWVSDLEFRSLRRLTNLNPQQKDIRWGDAELVHWRSLDGRPLKGILIKPEGFDARKKYPLMVHFYERMSRNLHRYVTPRPGTSPNASYYVSNGYLWFMPDIHYREGYPGESALKCIVPGVQMLIARGFVKEDGIGAAGHSWGGYQTAYLVTRTDIFQAVESGAPVSNMTSAYGGIRWRSGRSRAFQYEKSQSRIGGSLWEYPMRYLDNSPLFQADKVNTPVLMLHNDRDGAVPWYQGIEYFCALRRLGKEVYLFNYVGEPHGLRKRQNQEDWAMRMQQYFDHHLKGARAPEWMTDGVPYIEREREKLVFREPRSVRELAAMEASANEKAREKSRKKARKTILEHEPGQKN